MDLREQLTAYRHRIADPIRRRTFLRFVAERFWGDRLFESAGSLAYTTVFALVPLATVVFGMLSAFPVFAKWRVQLSDYIFSNFVPSSAREVEKYVIQFSDGAAQLTAAGVIALVVPPACRARVCGQRPARKPIRWALSTAPARSLGAAMRTNPTG